MAIPQARKEKIEQLDNGSWSIAVKEPALRNLANTRIRQLLAEWYDIPMGKVRLVSGHRSPKKIFDIELET